MTVLEPAARRVSFGKLSVLIAVCIFVVVPILFIVAAKIPEKPPSLLHDVVAGAAVIAIFIAAPLGHLTGLVLGVMALFRAGDRKGLGVVGIILNIVVVAIGMFLVYMAAVGLSGFR